MKLDFSEIKDDQLVELIRAALVEAAQRTQAVRMAAQGVFLDEAEKARIAQEAAARETERLRETEAERIAREAAEKVRRLAEQEAEKNRAAKTESQWEKKNAIIARVHEIFGAESFMLTVWNKTDKRIYLRREKDKFGNNCVEFFCEGNQRNRPGTLILSSAYEEKRAEITAFLKEICGAWKNLELVCD